MTEDLDALDKLLADLRQVLDLRGTDDSPDEAWARLELLESSMGSDALRAILRRQGMSQNGIDEAITVLANRREAAG